MILWEGNNLNLKTKKLAKEKIKISIIFERPCLEHQNKVVADNSEASRNQTLLGIACGWIRNLLRSLPNWISQWAKQLKNPCPCSYKLNCNDTVLFYSIFKVRYFIFYFIFEIEKLILHNLGMTHEILCSLSNFPTAAILTYAQHPELTFQMKMDLFIFCIDYYNLQQTYLAYL